MHIVRLERWIVNTRHFIGAIRHEPFFPLHFAGGCPISCSFPFLLCPSSPSGSTTQNYDVVVPSSRQTGKKFMHNVIPFTVMPNSGQRPFWLSSDSLECLDELILATVFWAKKVSCYTLRKNLGRSFTVGHLPFLLILHYLKQNRRELQMSHAYDCAKLASPVWNKERPFIAAAEPLWHSWLWSVSAATLAKPSREILRVLECWSSCGMPVSMVGHVIHVSNAIGITPQWGQVFFTMACQAGKWKL